MRLPQTKNTPLVRVDFSDDAAWDMLCELVLAPVGDYRAYVDCVSLEELEGATPAQLVEALPEGSGHSIILVADTEALRGPDHAVLVVNAEESPLRSFRAIPSQAWSVENNLSLANMDFDEFMDAADSHRVFRGFPDSP